MTTPADHIRAVLTDPATPRRTRDGWLTLTDLHRTLTANYRLSQSDIDRGVDELLDELDMEWPRGRGVRVRLAPVRTRQLTLGGEQ